MFFRIKDSIINADQIAEFSFDTETTSAGVEVTFYVMLTNGVRVDFANTTHNGGTDVEKVARTESRKDLKNWVKGMIFLN